MSRLFSNLASRSAYLMGHPAAFILSVAACLLWAASGPFFSYSDTWQLVINTATTVLTFLAVFLIQNSQNRDGAAIQAKLDEVLIAVGKARTELVGIENLTDSEVSQLKVAIEREALEPDTDHDDDYPTVDQILEGRNNDKEVVETAAKVIKKDAGKKAAPKAGPKTARTVAKKPARKKPAAPR